MKRTLLHLIVLNIIFLSFILYPQQKTSIKEPFESKNLNFDQKYTVVDENDTNLFYNSLIKYSNKLIDNANTTEGGWSWKRYLNLPDDPGNPLFSQYHLGYYYGVAGIGDTFIRIYNLTKNTSYLIIAENSANYIIKKGIIDFESFGNSYIHWTRATDSVTIYTGMKYGYAGIIKFFLNLFEQTNNNTYLDVATKSLDALIYYDKTSSFGDPYWGYNIWTNSGLTGYTYGTSGIGEVFLDAYRITSNLTYLDVAVDSVNWILNLTQKIGIGDQQQFAIIASSASGWKNNISGLYTGAAGVGKFFLKLFATTNNEIYLDYSKAISRWLISVMDEGYWQYGAVDFLTEIDIDQGYFNGLAAGSAGIGLFFLELFKFTNDSNFLFPVNKILTSLSENARNEGNTTSWTAQKYGYWSGKVYTGIGFGLAGIGKFYTAIYDNFGDFSNSTKSSILGIHNYYNLITNESTGLIPYVIPAENGITFYRSDYFDGLAGIIDFYLDALYALNTTQPIYLPEILETATTISFTEPVTFSTSSDEPVTFSTSSDEPVTFSTSSDEPVSTDFSFFNPLTVVAIFIVIILKISKRKRKRD